jgi:hypothetical protein
MLGECAESLSVLEQPVRVRGGALAEIHLNYLPNSCFPSHRPTHRPS